MPAATDNKFCSAIPTLINRCGKSLRNKSKLGAPKSADTITISSPNLVNSYISEK